MFLHSDCRNGCAPFLFCSCSGKSYTEWNNLTAHAHKCQSLLESTSICDSNHMPSKTMTLNEKQHEKRKHSSWRTEEKVLSGRLGRKQYRQSRCIIYNHTCEAIHSFFLLGGASINHLEAVWWFWDLLWMRMVNNLKRNCYCISLKG